MPSPSDPLCSIPLPSRFATANPRGRWRPGQRRRLGRPRRLPPPSSSSPRRLPPRHDLPGVFFPAFVGRSGNRIWMSSQHPTFFSLFRGGVRGREGVVLLQPARPQVRDGAAHQLRHAVRLLEGHRQGLRHQPRRWGCARRWCSTRGGRPRGGRRSGSCTSSAWKTTTRSLPPQGTTISRKTGCCAGYCTRVEPLQGHHLKSCVFCGGGIESISSDISGFTSAEATRENIKLLIKSLSRLL